MIHHTAATQEQTANSPAHQIIMLLHQVLSMKDAQATQTPEPGRRGRPPLLSQDHLWLAMLLAMLQGLSGFASIWRLICWTGVGHWPILHLSRAAIRKRLLQANLDGLHEVLRRVSQALLSWTAALPGQPVAPFASAVLALDQSTLEAVRRSCQDVRQEAADSPRLLVGSLAALFDLRRQQWVRVLLREDVFANEKLFVEALLAGLPTGSLLLFDLGSFSFPWFDWLSDQGYWWLSRLREKTSYQVAHVFVQHGSTWDGLVWLGAYRADRAGHLVRLIQFEHGGRRYRYLTNVCDPAVLSLHEAACLYARRWEIELAFKTLKRELGLHLWWSSHQVLVLQQLLCGFILAQLLHAWHLRVAAEAGVDLFEVSLPVLVKLLAQAPTRLMSESSLCELLIGPGRRLGLIRPSRRTQVVTPALLEPFSPAPPDLLRQRPARYARCKCAPRSHRVCFQPRFFSFFLI